MSNQFVFMKLETLYHKNDINHLEKSVWFNRVDISKEETIKDFKERFAKYNDVPIDTVKTSITEYTVLPDGYIPT